MRAHTLDMTVGSPARLLLRFSLPLFVGNLLQQVYNLADTAIAAICSATRRFRRSARPPRCTA